MKAALYVPNVGEFADARALAELGEEAEDGGWDGFFIWDELAFSSGPGDHPAACDPWVALAAIAMRTKGLRIGTLITPVARRRPQKLARETVTLDHLSAGRLTLGVGLGVPAESEFARFGEEADGRIRAEKLDEGLAVLARFWSGEPFSFEGKHVRIRDMAFLPTPVQRPRIPIWVGGEWPNKAPMRRAARWDGVVPVSPGWPDEVLTPDDYRALLQYIGAHRREAGPFEVAFMTSWAGDRPGNDSATLAAYADAGVTWWLQEADGLASARKWLRAGPPRS